ncbi:MAG: signal peptidase II [Chlorobiaceae bacterium]|jgi:signal peptidase II|nr:signal peptidase II [Chlorobiaceae bacterium]NTV17302.1 signal peptidase II [Chlorobiaceae bacterium]
MKLFFSIILLVVTVDQLTKKLAITFLRDGVQSITIIPDLFFLTYAENKGVAFGLEFAPPMVLLLLTGLITAIVLFYVIWSKNRTALFLVPFALITGGGIGNMIDRVTLGRVVDFIYFDLYHGHVFGTYLSLWPIFNIADSAITIGACMLIIFHNKVFPDGTPELKNDVC